MALLTLIGTRSALPEGLTYLRRIQLAQVLRGQVIPIDLSRLPRSTPKADLGAVGNFDPDVWTGGALQEVSQLHFD
jgi:hypothetical protein